MELLLKTTLDYILLFHMVDIMCEMLLTIMTLMYMWTMYLTKKNQGSNILVTPRQMILISLQLYFNLKSSPCEVGLKLTADNFSPTGGSMNRAGQSFYVRAILKRGKLLNSQFVQQRWWHKRWSGGNTSERAGLESRDKLGFFI